jgi:hypothetical protein
MSRYRVIAVVVLSLLLIGVLKAYKLVLRDTINLPRRSGLSV